MKRPLVAIRRKSALTAERKLSAQLEASDSDAGAASPGASPSPSSSASGSDAVRPKRDASSSPEPPAPAPRAKKRRTTAPPASRSKVRKAEPFINIFAPEFSNSPAYQQACAPPARRHALAYHRPLLLGRDPTAVNGRAALLAWFDGVSGARAMPWRKAWIDPTTLAADETALRAALEVRAYEVWISEIMLQQTRVAVVIDYWNRWMAKWPTIHDLAAADAADVLGAWRGLGYYSRATRIHEAAKLVVADPGMRGLLPQAVAELEAKVPGVGRYTAGAISAIVFGHASPMVDGNVLRVLSRQMGVLGDVKKRKEVIDALWAAAGALVGDVARDGTGEEAAAEPEEEPKPSDRPGRWGQALMELGSTVCLPKPNCAACPVTATCRAYQEGVVLAAKKGLMRGDATPAAPATVVDIEDACALCEPFAELDGEMDDEVDKADKSAVGRKKEPLKQAKLSFALSRPVEKKREATPTVGPKAMEVIADHARKFPVKSAKKAVPQEEALVCAVQRADGCWLIQQRPSSGLLASMWEFPTLTLSPTDEAMSAKAREQAAKAYMSELLAGKDKANKAALGLRHLGELDSVPWVFSHLKLTMHVHLFSLGSAAPTNLRKGAAAMKWASGEAVESENMGTGMRKCWALAKEADEM